MRLRAGVQHDEIAPEAQVERLSVREGLSQLFDVRLEISHPDQELDLAALLDTTCEVALEDQVSGDVLRFHGVIEEASALEPARLERRHELRLRPRLAALGQRVRSRLFQEKSAVDVVKEVLSGAGLSDEKVSFRLDRAYPRRELCVQYRESELDFVLRLLEDEGIFFWFEQGEGGHVLALGDAPGVHQAIAGERALTHTRSLHGDRESVSDLVFSTEVGPDVHLTRDWNWQRPASVLEAEIEGSGARGRVWYEYPGGFADQRDGGRRARDRLEAVDRTRLLSGRTNCLRLAPGRLFDVVDATPRHLEAEWLVTEIEHAFEALPGSAGEGEGTYTARFRAIPGDAPFRPARRAPRPRVPGKQLAVVTGPGGEDIHVDDMARVKLHFLWDREGATDDTSSSWIRVQQLNTSGSMILPRIGWELDVGFLDGDPDRPVALQRLYNRDGMPPEGLPGAKTKSSLQTHTTGGGEGVNALAMEDGSGGMELGLTASRNLDVVVGHDATEQVGTDASHEVGLDLQTLVGGKEQVKVSAGQSTAVGGSATHETVGSKTVSIGGMDSLGVKKLQTFTCDGSREETIGGVANVLAAHSVETVNGSSTREIGAALSMNAVKGLVEVVAGSKTESTGAARVEILRGAHDETISGNKVLTAAAVVEKAGKDVSVAAKGNLTLTVGGVLAEKVGGGFTLSGPVVTLVAASATLQGGGSQIKAGGSLSLKGSKLSVKGASVTIKGTIDYKG
jgi:type VI secretion system secreted protein VgrG